jgi:hypothetical protein
MIEEALMWFGETVMNGLLSKSWFGRILAIVGFLTVIAIVAWTLAR